MQPLKPRRWAKTPTCLGMRSSEACTVSVSASKQQPHMFLGCRPSKKSRARISEVVDAHFSANPSWCDFFGTAATTGLCRAQRPTRYMHSNGCGLRCTLDPGAETIHGYDPKYLSPETQSNKAPSHAPDSSLKEVPQFIDQPVVWRSSSSRNSGLSRFATAGSPTQRACSREVEIKARTCRLFIPFRSSPIASSDPWLPAARLGRGGGGGRAATK